MKTVIVTIHGQESTGKKLKELSNRLKRDINGEVAFVNLRYPKLLTIVNTLPWVRKMTAKFIAARLNGIMHKYREAKIIVIAHSNGTRALQIAMDSRNMPDKNWSAFRVDGIILLGCVIKRKYDWKQHPYTRVINFISSNDKVVWLARFYGMGSAGRFGFKISRLNLMQLRGKFGHTGFMQRYYTIMTSVKFLMSNKPFV